MKLQVLEVGNKVTYKEHFLIANVHHNSFQLYGYNGMNSSVVYIIHQNKKKVSILQKL